MSFIPMHNRFVEGFVESDSRGDTIDALSSRILPGGPAIDAGTLQHSARAARAAAIRAALIAVWAALRRVVVDPPRTRFDAWRERRHAAHELFALDDRSLAELGLTRPEIPFVVARPVAQRDQRPVRRATAGNDDQPKEERDPPILPIYFVK
jgi:uncharacterized protein YjiS (DUF1127 family)